MIAGLTNTPPGLAGAIPACRDGRSSLPPLRGPQPLMPTFTQYAGELTSRLDDMVQKGRAEAAAHRPPSEATKMDQHEAAVQTEAERWAASENQILSSIVTNASRSAAEIQQKALELEGRIEQFLADSSLDSAVAADMAEDRHALVQCTEARMRAEVDWRHFRVQNRITEQAVYPESRVWHFAIIILLSFLETCMNAFFYENAQGLLGGFAVAAGVAVVNMAGALVLGIGFRYKNLRASDKRALGWACLAVFIVLTIYCNALFAAFRGEYQQLADPTDPRQIRAAFTLATEAASRVFIFNMHFPDLMSFILFGLGLLLSSFAFYKGYTIDDKFPGYGAKDRAVKAARAAEQVKQEAVRQRVKELLQNRRHQLQALIHEPAQLVNAVGARAADLQHATSAYATQQDAVQRDFALLLRTYRDANIAIRATEPPVYFRNVPDLRMPPNQAAIASAAQSLVSVQESVRQLRDKHQAALNAKLNELQRDTATLLNQAFAKFLEGVEADAETVINRETATIREAA